MFKAKYYDIFKLGIRGILKKLLSTTTICQSPKDWQHKHQYSRLNKDSKDAVGSAQIRLDFAPRKTDVPIDVYLQQIEEKYLCQPN